MGRLLRLRFIRFGMVGAFNTLLDWFVYFLVWKQLGTGYKIWLADTDTWAKAAGIAVGLTSAFLLNSRWVFKDHGFHNHLHEEHTFSEKMCIIGKSYVKFAATYSVGITVNMLTYMLMKRLQIDSFPPEYGLGMASRLPALVVSTGVSSIFNYLFCKHFVFRPKSTKVIA